ncbi:MAG: glycosyltransferase family 1 protein [Acidimicrobiales bacterium]|nr:glycosyltransferase family 1 protein [Acidimicrobiales bacterium]
MGDTLMLPGHARYWSDRYPELLGRGAFLIAPAPPGSREHYQPGVHFVAYQPGQLDQVFRLVDEWARPEMAERRHAIATAAREHTLAHHTYHHRIRGLLDRLAELHPHLRAAP